MTDSNFDMMRRAMVASQLRPNAVTDVGVIAAMAAVPRERFVPAERAALAYVDRSVPLGGGRALNPAVVTGRLLSELRPRAGERVLVVGAATGYAAAVLARIVGSVTALEEADGPKPVAVDGVSFVTGPLAQGWAAGAPYDVILIDGAVEAVPDAIVAQLADDGRLGVAIVERGVARLATGRKAGDGFGLRIFLDGEAAALPGFARPAVFSF